MPITLSANWIQHRFIQSTSSSGIERTNIILGDVCAVQVHLDLNVTWTSSRQIDARFQVVSRLLSPKKEWKRKGKEKQHFLDKGTDSFENLSVHASQTKHRRLEQLQWTIPQDAVSKQVQRGLNHSKPCHENVIILEP